MAHLVDMMAGEPPDMSDLSMVIVNVETREGQQYSIILDADDLTCMSLSFDTSRREETEIMDGSGEIVRVLPQIEVFTFGVQKELRRGPAES